MTRSPEPDTTAIRAMIERDNFEFDPHTDGVALLDALDAARAERDAAKGIASRYMDRAEAAEARIAGLVELCRDMLPYVPDYFRVKWDYDAELAKLTEDQK